MSSSFLKCQQQNFECPICLAILLNPITLTCGHTFCEPCIKSKYFKYIKSLCPICRKSIPVGVNYFAVDMLLNKILLSLYGQDKVCQERNRVIKSGEQQRGRAGQLAKWLKEKAPWILVGLLLFHLLSLKIAAFAQSFQKYKEKALNIADSIKGENSLDFKFLLFSQFMRILFSNIIIH